MSGVVVPFPERAVVVAYGIVREPHRHGEVELGLACSVLVEGIRGGLLMPPDTLDRLVVLAVWGPAPLDLRRRLADALAGISDPVVQGRAVVQLRDPATPSERREIARRLLGAPR